MFSVFEILQQFLLLVFALQMFYSSSHVQMLFAFSPLDYMTYFTSTIIVMFYLLFLLIKLYGKLLIVPTVPSHHEVQLALPSPDALLQVHVKILHHRVCER